MSPPSPRDRRPCHAYRSWQQLSYIVRFHHLLLALLRIITDFIWVFWRSVIFVLQLIYMHVINAPPSVIRDFRTSSIVDINRAEEAVAQKITELKEIVWKKTFLKELSNFVSFPFRTQQQKECKIAWKMQITLWKNYSQLSSQTRSEAND